MKQVLFGAAMLCAMAANAQEKSDYVSYNRLIDIKGSDYVVASAANANPVENAVKIPHPTPNPGINMGNAISVL